MAGLSGGVIAASRGEGLEDSSTSNALVNSKFNNDNYPVGYTYPNNPQTQNYRQNSGVTTQQASWASGSSLYFVSPPYTTMLGNQYLYSWGDYELAPFKAGFIPRINKIYGVSNLFKGNTVSNNNADRGAGWYGNIGNVLRTRIVNHTTLTTINANTSMDHTSIWVDSTKWSQVVDVPDSATTVKFGAQIRIPSGDKLRLLNWAGIAITQDSSNDRTVNYFGIRHTNATFTLPTSESTNNKGYNWAGLGTTISNSVFYTPETFTATEHAMLDQDNYEEFTKVEYTFTLNSGTSRKIMMHIFFAENAKYMFDEDTELTGGFQYYDPFIEFS
jgi:hypothetical protein